MSSQNRLLTFAKWALFLILGMLGAVLIISWMINFYVGIGVDERNPVPGKLVDIGVTKLHMNCTGEGSPTVILETGSNAWSSSWTKVQQEASQSTRVCSYDRGGLGWSEPGASPRNYETQLQELSALLERSGESAPYVMVGWSYGGPLAWLYTARNPEKVVGLVMVDSATFRYQNWIKENYPELYASSQLGPKIMGFIHNLRLGGAVLTMVSSSEAANPFFSSMQTNDVGFLLRGFPAILDEGRNLESSIQMFSTIPEIGDLPLVVIESGKVMDVPGMPGFGDELKIQFHADQMGFLNYSNDTEYLVAENSGHNIPSEAPEVVVRAIRNVLQKLEN